MRSAPLGRSARGVVCLVAARRRLQQPRGSTPGRSRRQGRPSLRHVRGRQGPVPDRMTEGGPTGTSRARGGKNLVRPHQGAVRPTKSSPKCSGPGGSPPRGSLP
jgi:hypothetical protein